MQKRKKNLYIVRSQSYCPAYPNEADVNYYTRKLLDIVTGIISGFGLIVSILFLATIM